MHQKLLFDIGHPAHVHYFRNAIGLLTSRGYECIITIRPKEITEDLLQYYQIPYYKISDYESSLVNKIFSMINTEKKLYRLMKKELPILGVSFGSPYLSHVSKLLDVRHIIFSDTEHAWLNMLLSFPFAHSVYTPRCYPKEIRSTRHVKFNGYMELAYLHPNYYSPSKDILSNYDIQTPYVLFRFVKWTATHDIGITGISLENKIKLINSIKNDYNVYVSSEGELPDAMEDYRLNTPPHRIHDVISYSSLFVGDGATMASEAGVLGVPSIYINPLSLSYLLEQEVEYNTVVNISDPNNQLNNIITQMKYCLDPEIRKIWIVNQTRLLNEKIDVTEYMVNEIESIISK